MIFDLLLDVCLKLFEECYFMSIFQFRQKIESIKTLPKKIGNTISSKMVCMKIFRVVVSLCISKQYAYVITARSANQKNKECT